MDALQLGSIVRYSYDFHIALGYDGSLVKLIAPHLGNRKLNVSRGKVHPTGLSCTLITFQGKRCLVSARGTIISLVSNRVLKNTTKNGRAMVAKAQWLKRSKGKADEYANTIKDAMSEVELKRIVVAPFPSS